MRNKKCQQSEMNIRKLRSKTWDFESESRYIGWNIQSFVFDIVLILLYLDVKNLRINNLFMDHFEQ